MKSFIHLPIRLLTHNIRYATKSPFRGEEPWTIRAPKLLNELRYNTLYNQEAFICLQEVLHNQLTDILAGLNGNCTEPEWAYIGVGREDGQQGGEYSPILYRQVTWELHGFRNLWLSETPDIPSKGWDAASTRILTIGEFKHRPTGQKLIAMNTHLDDQGSTSRLEAAKIIATQVQGYLPMPVFLAGDFNSEPGQEAYTVLSAERSPVRDLRDAVPASSQYGHQNTYTGFGYEGEPEKRIDFLFLSKDGWDVNEYTVLESRFEDGVFNSDHRAVVGDVVLRARSH